MIAMIGKLQAGQRTVASGSISPETTSSFVGILLVPQKLSFSKFESSWCGFIMGVAFGVRGCSRGEKRLREFCLLRERLKMRIP